MAIRAYVRGGGIHGFQDAVEVYPENYEKAVGIIKQEHIGEITPISTRLSSSRLGGDSVLGGEVYCLKDKDCVYIGKVKNKHTPKGKEVHMMRIISQDEKSLSELEKKLGLRGIPVF